LLNPQNYIFSLALKLGTYTPYLLLVVVYSRKRRKKENNSKAQALACLMSIVLSFFMHFVIDCWTSLS
jgi:uncharacterized protein YggT (Ycf19 family)